MKRLFYALVIASPLLVSAQLPTIPSTGIVPCNGFDSCDWDAFLKLGGNIYNGMVAIAVPVATIIIVIAGITYLVRPNDPGKRAQAKTALTAAVIGLVIILASYIIVKTVLDFLLKPGINPL